MRPLAASMSRSSGTAGSIRSSPSRTAKGASPTNGSATATACPSPSASSCRAKRTWGIVARRTAASASDFPLASSSASRDGSRAKCSRSASCPGPSTTTTSSRPLARASSTTSWIAGTSTTGSRPLGCAFVAGRNRVPSPAAGITPVRTVMRAESSRRPPVHLPRHANLRVPLSRLRPFLRHRAEDERRPLDALPRMRRPAPEGLHGSGHLVQGLGVLRDGSRLEGQEAGG